MNDGPARTRASDAERERVAATIRQAMGEGRLTLAEGEQRLTEVYAAVYRDELPRVTADLPPPEPAPAPPNRSWPGERGRWRGRRGRPVRPLLLIIAVGLGIWAVAGSGPLWPAILLGVLAFIIGGRRHCRPRPPGSDQEPGGRMR
jgi:hypothetical protein